MVLTKGNPRAGDGINHARHWRWVANQRFQIVLAGQHLRDSIGRQRNHAIGPITAAPQLSRPPIARSRPFCQA